MKLPCYLVRDLLPLYKDQVCEPDTAADVEEHLEECADCRAALEALDGPAKAEAALETEQKQAETAVLRKMRGRLRKRIWLPVCAVLVAVTVLVAGGLGFCHWASRQPVSIVAGDIARVYRTDGNALCFEMQPGKTCTAMSACYVTIRDGTGTHEAALFTSQVDLWSSLTDSGWQGEKVIFQNLLDTATEAYFVNWDDWADVMDAARGTDDDYVMTDVPDTMHLMWQRDDAAAPAAP